MKRKKKPRNPKPSSQGPLPVANKRVGNKPFKPARSGSFQRTRENAQDAPGDDARGALDSLLDEAGPDDLTEFDT